VIFVCFVVEKLFQGKAAHLCDKNTHKAASSFVSLYQLRNGQRMTESHFPGIITALSLNK